MEGWCFVNWAPGTLVICVDDGPYCSGLPVKTIGLPLVRGSVYTVRTFVSCYKFTTGTEDAVKVQECARVSQPSGVRVDDHFAASRFRLAEGGQCESTRAQAMKQVKV